MRMKRYLITSCVYVLAFWAVWQFATLFELANHVSAFYPGPALTIALIAVYGPRYLPAVWIAVTFSSLPQKSFLGI
jgi:hypothetical protein